jgi:hypothetical protein
MEQLPPALYEAKVPAILEISWPDFGVPRRTGTWWELLADTLLAYEGVVGICCTGGHGRTGTALSILVVLMGALGKKECPVKWVRKHYCGRAVENQAQADYIEEMSGRKIKTKIKADDGYNYAGHWYTPDGTAGGLSTGAGSASVLPTKTERDRMWDHIRVQVTGFTTQVKAKIAAETKEEAVPAAKASGKP